MAVNQAKVFYFVTLAYITHHIHPHLRDWPSTLHISASVKSESALNSLKLFALVQREDNSNFISLYDTNIEIKSHTYL